MGVIHWAVVPPHPWASRPNSYDLELAKLPTRHFAVRLIVLIPSRFWKTPYPSGYSYLFARRSLPPTAGPVEKERERERERKDLQLFFVWGARRFMEFLFSLD